MKNSRFRHIFNHFGVAAVTAVLFGSIGTYFVRASFAASWSSNPTAYADYCALENNHTVLYGWGYDPESNAGDQPYVTVKVGATSWTVATNKSAYRVAQVNSWIDTYYAGAPKMGTYGWRLEITGYYKNISYPVSGSVANVGAGANTALQVNSDFTFPGEGAAKTIFTADKKIPNGCLATAPPAPAPAPAPAPTPTPTPTTPRTTTPRPTTPRTTTPSPATPAAPTLSNAADATVTAGTSIASISVPSGNAKTLYIRYGTDANSLNRSSSIQTVSGATTTVKLEKLTGKATYTYQIVRTLDKQNTTSANATFTTKGYDVALYFRDATGQPVKGIKVELGKNKAVTSDKDGKVAFASLSSGSYSPIFSYNGMSYSEEFTTSSAIENSETGTAVLTKTVDLSKLQKSAQVTPQQQKQTSGGGGGIIALSFLFLVLVGALVWWIIWRKRRKQAEEDYLAQFAPPTPLSVVSAPEPEPESVVTAVAHHSKHRKAHQPVPAPTHMGESLRDMVIQSMAEDTAKHPESHNKKPPIVPGG